MPKGRSHNGPQKPTLQRRQKQTAIGDSLRQTLLPQVNQLPLRDCWVAEEWDQQTVGIVQVVIAREQPNARLAYATFLLDIYCLGVKNAHYDMNLAVDKFEFVLDHLRSTQPMIECAVELAHQIVYQSLDYGAQWGFQPHPDFAKASYFLAPRGTYPESYAITFGKDGKPFYVQGPYDDAPAILAQLAKTAGPGNYLTVAEME